MEACSIILSGLLLRRVDRSSSPTVWPAPGLSAWTRRPERNRRCRLVETLEIRSSWRLCRAREPCLSTWREVEAEPYKAHPSALHVLGIVPRVTRTERRSRSRLLLHGIRFLPGGMVTPNARRVSSAYRRTRLARRPSISPSGTFDGRPISTLVP